LPTDDKIKGNPEDEDDQDKDFKFVKHMLDDIYKETKKTATKEEFWAWSEQYNNWLELIRPMVKTPVDLDTANSMVFFRLMELQHDLQWVHVCMLFGRYHSVMRELRYDLESMMQAYYLDAEHPTADVGCKLEIVKEIDRQKFSRLVDGLDLDHKQTLKSLYSDLSKYVHSSYQELRRTIEEGRIWERVAFGFEYDMFQKCVEMMNRVLDVAYYLMMMRFPVITTKLGANPLTLKSLEKYHSTLALDYYNSQKAGL
jgi:hypothetical protein